ARLDRDPPTEDHDDLDRATRVARRMVAGYGMSDRLGPVTLGTKQAEPFLGRDFSSHPDYSDRVAFEIDTEIRDMIDRAHDEALEILQEHRRHLDAIAAALIERSEERRVGKEGRRWSAA